MSVYSFIAGLVVVTILLIPGKSTPIVELPKTWTKNYTITLSYTGSMDGSSTLLTFAYDSCTYSRNSGMNPKKEDTFAMTTKDRATILKKMHELNVDKIKSKMSLPVVNDGWSSTLCFGSDCISEGPAFDMSEQDKEAFSQAYDFLEAFAAKRVDN